MTFKGFNLAFYVGLLLLACYFKFPPGTKLEDLRAPMDPEWSRIATWVIACYVALYYLAVGAVVSLSTLVSALTS